MENPFRLVSTGAIYGVTTALTYATVEYLLTTVGPLALSRQEIVSLWAWPLVGTLFLAYACIGLLLGGLASSLAWFAKLKQDEKTSRALATLVLALAFGLHLLSAWPLARSEGIALAVAIAVATALTAVILSDAWSRRLGFLASPWTVSSLLLAAPSISRDMLAGDAGMAKLACVAAGLVGIAGVAAVAYWFFPPRATVFMRLGTTVVMLAGSCIAVWLLSNRGFSLPERTVQVESGKTSVLLITMDTVRADHLSVYGYDRETSPNLRKFASGATLYQRAIAAADATLPSHASIFTGLYPSWHRAHYTPPQHPYGYPLDTNQTTLAEVLSTQGYVTAAVAANWAYLSPTFGVDQGFQLYQNQAPIFVSNWQRPFYMREAIRHILEKMISMSEFDRRTKKAEEINQEAFSVLNRANKKQPMFLFLNYMDAHSPYVVPAPYDSLFPGKDPRFSEEHLRDIDKEILQQRRSITEDERRHITSQYDGGIAYLDSQLGRLFDRLKESGLYDDMLIIVTADHGEAIGEKDIMEHAMTSMYENQVHIPLIIKYPRQTVPRTETALVSQVDVMPTVLDVLGYSSPSPVHGLSLVKPLPVDRRVLSESFPGWPVMNWNRRFDGIRRAMFVGSKKLITWTNGPSELYDLSRDPNEMKDLSHGGDSEVTDLEEQFTSWVRSLPAIPRASSSDGGVNVERLKSLGYAQ